MLIRTHGSLHMNEYTTHISALRTQTVLCGTDCSHHDKRGPSYHSKIQDPCTRLRYLGLALKRCTDGRNPPPPSGRFPTTPLAAAALMHRKTRPPLQTKENKDLSNGKTRFYILLVPVPFLLI